MKNTLTLLLAVIFLTVVSCRDTKNETEETEAKIVVEQVESVEAESEEIIEKIEAESKELESELKELDKI